MREGAALIAKRLKQSRAHCDFAALRSEQSLERYAKSSRDADEDGERGVRRPGLEPSHHRGPDSDVDGRGALAPAAFDAQLAHPLPERSGQLMEGPSPPSRWARARRALRHLPP